MLEYLRSIQYETVHLLHSAARVRETNTVKDQLKKDIDVDTPDENGWNGSNEQPATAKQIGSLRRLGVKDRIERGSQCRCRPNRTLVDSQVSDSIQ